MYNINSYNIIAKNKKVSELFLGTLILNGISLKSDIPLFAQRHCP